MKKLSKQLIISMITLLIIQHTVTVSADSLWTGMTISDNSYFVDGSTKQRKINDIVFIIISEETIASVEAARDYDTESSYTGGVNTWFGVDGWDDLKDMFLKFKTPQITSTLHNDPEKMPAWDLQIDNEWDGEAESTRSNSVRTKIAARIIEIRPNGNMLIEGKRVIQINDENSELLLSGMTRHEDIDSYNQIQSSKIADLRISVIGKGELTRSSKPGVLSTILSYFQ